MNKDNLFLEKLIKLRKEDRGKFEILRYFENRATDYKSKLSSVATWLIGIQTAIIVSPVGLGIFKFEASKIDKNQLILILPIVVILIAFTIYSINYINKINEHIGKNENRSNAILEDNFELLKNPARNSRTYLFHKKMLKINPVACLIIYILVYLVKS